MPLYEYECDACGHRFEVIVKFSDPPLETCPSCGGHVHKLMSSPAFQFKGTGWYVTDYAKKDHVPAGKATGSEGDSSGKDKDDKGGKSEKGEKSDKTEKSDKSDKGSSTADSSSSSSASPTPNSSPSSSKKDSSS
jgi:putative FmdB family regulatory protein